MTEKPTDKRQGWIGLLLFSLVVFSLGMTTGNLLTLYPQGITTSLWAKGLLYGCYAGLWLIALAGFTVIGGELRRQ